MNAKSEMKKEMKEEKKEKNYSSMNHQAKGSQINLKNCKVNTCESNPKCKSF
jgi:hypothetical protein